MTRWIAIAAAIGSLTACSGGSSSPTTPTSSVPPANIAGSYALTITASPSCAATVPFSILGFAATITQTGATAQAQLVAHAPGAPTGNVSGTVSGQTVTFQSFALSEAMGRGAALTASSTVNVAPDGLTITGTLNGTFKTSSGASCTAADHKFEMVKQCLQQTEQGTILLPCIA